MYRCVRGTNAVEGYHFHLKMLIAQSCTSPARQFAEVFQLQVLCNLFQVFVCTLITCHSPTHKVEC